MRRALGTALCVAPVAVTAALAQLKATAYKAPRTAFGQPDLSGYWSNSTLTPLMRPAAYGARAAHTPEEVKRMEAGARAEEAEKAAGGKTGAAPTGGSTN